MSNGNGGRKSVVVVGAGIGGMGVGALLQARGYQVTVVEKNNFVGGKASSYERDGFVVDSAFHVFSQGRKGPHGIINEKIGGDLRWIVHDPFATARMGRGGGRKDTWQIPQSLFTAAPFGGLAYLKGALRPSIVKTLKTVLKNFGVKEFIMTLIKIAMVDETFIASIDDMTFYEFISKFTEDEKIHRLMANLSLISFVVPYNEGSAGELLWCLIHSYRKGTMGVPMGGVRQIAGTYGRRLIAFDGNLRLGTGVKRIIVEDGKARGVETDEGEVIKADVVISNAGIKRTVEMAGEEHFPAQYVSYVKGLKESYAALMVKLALDRRIPGLPRLTLLHVPSTKGTEMVDFLRTGGIAEEPPMCMIMPSDWDPSTAPPGRCLLLAGGMGNSQVTPENIDHCERILDNVENYIYELYPEVKDHIVWKERYSVDHVSRLTGRPTGECIGLGQYPGQVGAKKPSVIMPVKDLMLVGCDAGARGVGTEQAAYSAIYVANLLG